MGLEQGVWMRSGEALWTEPWVRVCFLGARAIEHFLFKGPGILKSSTVQLSYASLLLCFFILSHPPFLPPFRPFSMSLPYPSHEHFSRVSFMSQEDYDSIESSGSSLNRHPRVSVT